MSHLTYAGFGLAYDHGGVVQKFIDNNQDFDDLRDVTSPLMVRADGLSLPQYTAPPRIRLNQLYWPTGASRWAIGYFLADKETKDSIVAKAHPPGGESTVQELVVNLDTAVAEGGIGPTPGISTTFDMFLLPPREITGNYSGDQNTLWLLILVDVRYYWQFSNIGDSDVPEGTSTWGDLFTALEDALPQTTADNAFNVVPAAYLGPDPQELTRLYDNAALMLDAAALSVGMRVAVSRGSSIRVETLANNETRHNENIQGTRLGGVSQSDAILAGQSDHEVAGVPASVDVVFRKFVDHVPLPQKRKVYNNTPSGEITVASMKATIHSTAYADFTTSGTGGTASTPDNNADLAALAAQITTDYYAWLTPAYDRTYPGLRLWEPTGFDNYILYQLGGEERRPRLSANTQVKLRGTDEDDTESATDIEESFERRFWTRVVSQPQNFGIEYQLSQDSSLTVLRPFQFGKLDEDLLKGDTTATVSVWDADDPTDRTDNTHSVTSDNIEVYNFSDTRLDSGSAVFCWFDYESERWYAIAARNEIIRFELTEDLDHGSGGVAVNAERVEWTGAAYAKDGTTIEVRSAMGDWSGVSGNQGWAIKMEDRPEGAAAEAYEILFLESNARFIEFTLTEDIDGTGQATATVDTFWGDAPNGVDPGSPVDVFDRQNGVGGRDLFEFALDGANGLAVWDENAEEYVIIRCETKAKWIRFSLTQDMATTDGSRTADVEDFWDGQDPDPDTNGIDVLNLDASNDWAFTGVINDIGLACFDEIRGEYQIVVMEDPAAGDDIWIGYSKANNAFEHLQPSTDTDVADNSIHSLQTDCGIGVDDAGHVIGAWDNGGTWQSPWGLGEPAGGAP